MSWKKIKKELLRASLYGFNERNDENLEMFLFFKEKQNTKSALTIVA